MYKNVEKLYFFLHIMTWPNIQPTENVCKKNKALHNTFICGEQSLKRDHRLTGCGMTSSS